MDKRTYFIKALASGACKKRDWVQSVFTVSQSGFFQDYPYQIMRSAEGVTFIDPEQEGREERISDYVTFDEPIFGFRERVSLFPGEFPNYTADEPAETTYGNLLHNWLLLVIPFHDKIPFQFGYMDAGKIESMIEPRLVDDPEEGETLEPGKIPVSEYIQFGEYGLSIVAYNPLAVQSVTPKSMLSHPAARQLRAELMELYKGQLNDPAIIAKIGNALEDLDRQWLKDDPTRDFYIAGKHFAIVRKKMYYMHGAESAFSDSTRVDFIPTSLEEGIDITQLPAMINSLREGSYNRGAMTQLGGELTKTIYRMMGNTRIEEMDCGATMGIPFDVSKWNRNDFVGFMAVENGKQTLITEDNLDQFSHRTVYLRTPMVCKTAGKNVCATCVGRRNAELENGLPAAMAQVGGRILTLFLKKMHGSSLKTQKYDLERRLT